MFICIAFVSFGLYFFFGAMRVGFDGCGDLGGAGVLRVVCLSCVEFPL